jgi:hypothetical protein
VGVNAGKVDKNYGDKNEETHYFVKFTTVSANSIDSLVDKLASMKFEFNNTVGPRSISKQELIAKMNAIL